MLEKPIGESIKSLREGKNLTLKNISDKTNLSISFISQVERNKSSLTLESFKKISEALGVNPSYFFSESYDKPTKVVRSDKEGLLNKTQFVYKDLSNNVKELNFIPIFVILQPEENRGNPFSHKGYEFIYILEGTLTIQIESEIFLLNAGDSIIVNSTKPHYWRNHCKSAVKFLCISTEKN